MKKQLDEHFVYKEKINIPITYNLSNSDSTKIELGYNYFRYRNYYCSYHKHTNKLTINSLNRPMNLLDPVDPIVKNCVNIMYVVTIFIMLVILIPFHSNFTVNNVLYSLLVGFSIFIYTLYFSYGEDFSSQKQLKDYTPEKYKSEHWDISDY